MAPVSDFWIHKRKALREFVSLHRRSNSIDKVKNNDDYCESIECEKKRTGKHRCYKEFVWNFLTNFEWKSKENCLLFVDIRQKRILIKRPSILFQQNRTNSRVSVNLAKIFFHFSLFFRKEKSDENERYR